MDTKGRRLRWLIEVHLKIKQAEFAREMGVPRQLLSRWINNPKTPPGEDSLQKIVKAAHKIRPDAPVSIAWLRYGTGETIEEATATLSIPDAIVLHTALSQIQEVCINTLGIEAVDPRCEFFGSAPDLMAIVRSDGEIVDVSERWESALGYGTEDLVGTNLNRIVTRPEDQKRIRWAFSLARKEGTVVDFETRSKKKGGGTRLVEWHAVAKEDRILLVGVDSVDRDPKDDVTIRPKDR